MTRARVACAIIVLGATVAGVAWAANYRVDMLVVSQRDGVAPVLPVGFPLHQLSAATDGTPVHAPVWWNAYAAIILLVLGVGIALRVVQKRLRPVQRTSNLLLRPVPEKGRNLGEVVRSSNLVWLLRPLPRHALNGLDWLVVEPLRLLVKR